MAILTRPSQVQLLSPECGAVESKAQLSRCRRYRYTLERCWDINLPTVMFIGLNPSTADEFSDDPTVRRCIGFARRWSFGSLLLANLFALRATDPKALLVHPSPIGPSNDSWIQRMASRADLVVAAWGTRGSLMNRNSAVTKSIEKLHCLATTKNGFPRHPLYMPSAVDPQPFVPT